MLRPRLAVCAVALSCAASCAYPRGTTPLSTVSQSPIDRSTQPEGLWQLQVVGAEVPREKRGGMSWDDEGGGPDPFLVFSIKGEERFRTAVVTDSFEPNFAVASPNLWFDRNARLRLELWDKDSLGADPIGMYEGKILSEAFIDADTRVELDSGASVSVRLRRPEPRSGVGIAQYELRPSGVLVISVIPNSPASRAGLRDGDRIVAIDGKPVAGVPSHTAETALALASQNRSVLRIEREKVQKTLKLDAGYVWPAE